jgi:hypothetical protein
MKLAIAVVVLGGCTTSHVVAPSPTHEVRIVRRADVAREETKAVPLELPFGQGQNGSVLVLALLQQATEAGAAYVTDLTFHMVFKRRGVIVECETKAVFRDDPLLVEKPAVATSSAPASEYSTDVTSFEPHAVSFTASEPELGCKQVAVAVTEVVPDHASLYDVDIPRIITKVPVEVVDHLERRDACELAQVTRAVTRYDFQKSLAYVPPRWSYIAARFADEPLVETAPLCYAIDPAQLGAQPVHRLSATLVYHRAIAHEATESPMQKAKELPWPQPRPAPR